MANDSREEPFSIHLESYLTNNWTDLHYETLENQMLPPEVSLRQITLFTCKHCKTAHRQESLNRVKGTHHKTLAKIQSINVFLCLWLYTHNILIKEMEIIDPFLRNGAYSVISVSRSLSAHLTPFPRKLLTYATKGFCRNYAVHSGLWKRQTKKGFLLSSAVVVLK